jgi:glycosyltransferase involved in cell wall biosynthesis
LKVLLFDPMIGGHHLEYAGHVAKYLREQGDEVVFVTSRKPVDRSKWPADLESVDVRELSSVKTDSSRGGPGLVVSNWRALRRCLRLARREPIDVLHVLYLDRSELALAALLALRTSRGGCPRAVFGTLFWPFFMHDRTEVVGLGKRLFHQASRRAIGHMLRRRTLDALFVHSDRIRSLLLAGLPGNVKPQTIVVVPDPAKEAPLISERQARSDLGLDADAPVILFFGRTRPDKGADILLSALPLLPGEWRVVLAGEADVVGKEEIEACERALGQPDRLIARFGHVSETDADRYFRAADVVVLPYRKAFKGTSGILGRAAASGKPVIATDVGDVGPAVREHGLGIVVPPESPKELAAALQYFLQHRTEARAMAVSQGVCFARANDWRTLGCLTRGTYLSSLREGL